MDGNDEAHKGASASTPAAERKASSSSTVAYEQDSSTPDCKTSVTSLHGALTPMLDNISRRPWPLRSPEYGTIRSSTSPSTNRPARNSQTASTLKRPLPAKRATSSAAPHRGDTFSAEDDPAEVDADNKLFRIQSKQGRNREKPSIRRESTIRRRPTTQSQSLSSPVRDEYSGAAQSTGMEFSNRGTDVGESVELHEDETQRYTSGQHNIDLTQAHEEDVVEALNADGESPEDDEEGSHSDAESFTLKDRQEAINETHPFGIRIWKPALYKKTRSVQKGAEVDIHSAPQQNVNPLLWIANVSWTIVFGWWLALLAFLAGIVCRSFGLCYVSGCQEYSRVLLGLAHYLLYPFGKYVRLDLDEAYRDEDAGEGRTLGEYERWQTGDLEAGRLFFGPSASNSTIVGRSRDEVEDPPLDETDPLLGRNNRQSSIALRAKAKSKKRLFGRGKWTFGRVIFFLSFYALIAPCLLLVSVLCWFFVFSIPMGKVTLLVFYHLRRHPLALSFHVDSRESRQSHVNDDERGSVILLCTYRAVGLRYWKYTIDGTNIFLINLLGLVAFTIFDYFILYTGLQLRVWATAPGFVFILGLGSIVPLAYFIGQAVASISAQSSMGVGATVNAFFSTIVEVFLYCIALKNGKAQLVEGSIIGSVFAAVLFLPGLSMCFGAIKRKTQRFNARSQSVTSTMLLFAVIGAFGPTLFYQIYGTHELNCHQCKDSGHSNTNRDCRRCYFSQVPAINDRFFIQAVRPYIYFASVCMFLSYMIGLLFTLRTHAAVIWNNEPDEKREARMEITGLGQEERHGSIHMSKKGTATSDANRTAQTIPTSAGKENIHDSHIYKRILSHSLQQVGITHHASNSDMARAEEQSEFGPGPRTLSGKSPFIMRGIAGLSDEDNRILFEQVAEMAATAAAVAARDATKSPRRAPNNGAKYASNREASRVDNIHATSVPAAPEVGVGEPAIGHNAPQWSRTKSAVILLISTVAYALIAEILVDTVDSVLSSIEIDEKFLGITLFALVPNTTEFLNAISFAMNGNVALSMEIGSSYALQVILLQAPCLVLFSACYNSWVPTKRVIDHTFSLIFPQWDMITVILGTFLMAWIVGEGKSNYFKGSILIFTYLVFVVGFYYSGFNNLDIMRAPVVYASS